MIVQDSDTHVWSEHRRQDGGCPCEKKQSSCGRPIDPDPPAEHTEVVRIAVYQSADKQIKILVTPGPEECSRKTPSTVDGEKLSGAGFIAQSISSAGNLPTIKF
jgi:hypothetical protein